MAPVALLLCLWQDPATLIDQLGDSDPAMREEATFRLLELGEKAVEPLTKALARAEGEARTRIQAILDSPYRGLDRKTAALVKEDEVKFDDLLKRLTSKDAEGMHGVFHRVDDEAQKQLWALLKEVPAYRGGARLLLAAIDRVYLAYHENGYHGWIWHRPYFDCAKAVALAERLEKEHPSQAEEALWTRLYCYRMRALPKGRASGYKYSGELAQIEWKADAAKVRAIGEEMLKRFPEGKYAKRVAELLKRDDPTFEPDRAGEELFGR